MTHTEERQRKAALRRQLDKVIGGRYIEVTEKAEGLAVITAEKMTPADIKAIVETVNSREVTEQMGLRMLDGDNWTVKPVSYQAYRHIIEEAPLTRRRYVTERTPLMEVRIHNA